MNIALNAMGAYQFRAGMLDQKYQLNGFHSAEMIQITCYHEHNGFVIIPQDM